MAKKLTAALLTVMGFLFITAYIRSATTDVVYTDYMRIINTYLPDVTDLSPYLRGDVLERIPVTFLERLFNVKVLGCSTTFDMLLGALGLAMCAAVTGCYCVRRDVRLFVIPVLMFIIFSLDKWEMLTNGTGWMHFWAIALFYLHFTVYDRVRGGCGGERLDTASLNRSKKKERVLLILPSLTILLIAGPYCAAYSGCVCLIYFIDCGRELWNLHSKSDIKRSISRWLPRFASVLVPFGLYFLSHMCLEYEYFGVTSMSLAQLMASDPGFLPGLLIRSFAGLVVTAETAQAAGLSDIMILCEGIVILVAYIAAIILNFKTGLYKKTAVPMMLMIMALLSHGLIAASRWIFLDKSYSMSSRYALQYMGGSIGILLTLFAACESKCKAAIRMEGTSQKAPHCHDAKDTENIQGRREAAAIGAGRHIGALPAFTLGISLLILSGQLMNYAQEIHMAPYRREAFENMRETAVNYEQCTDDELKRVLQYSDPARTRSALGILKENRWNVFRQIDPSDD